MSIEGLNSGTNESMSPAEALGHVEFARQRAMGMGGNDYENSRFDEILSDLSSGKIKPSEAVDLAENIVSSKQDYH